MPSCRASSSKREDGSRLQRRQFQRLASGSDPWPSALRAILPSGQKFRESAVSDQHLMDSDRRADCREGQRVVIQRERTVPRLVSVSGPSVALQVQISCPRDIDVRSRHRRAVRAAWGQRKRSCLANIRALPSGINCGDSPGIGPTEWFCRRRAGQPDCKARKYCAEDQSPSNHHLVSPLIPRIAVVGWSRRR